MTIAYYVHGRGRGHSSRALSVIHALTGSALTDIHIYAGRDAYPVLSHAPNCQPIQSIFPDSSPLTFIRRIIQDFNRLRKLKPNIIISDGDAPSVIAARILGIYSISIGHALVFPYCNHSIELPKAGLRKENLKVRIATQLSNYKFIVHFCKLPTRIVNAQVVRPELNFEPMPTKPFIISYFRDGNGHEIAQHILDKGYRIKNFGTPILLDGVENVDPNTNLFREAFNEAQAVISSAGSNVIFEAMAMNKPLLVLYKRGDFEQMANSKYLEQLEMGVSTYFDDIDINKVNKFLSIIDAFGIERNPLEELPVLPEALLQHLDKVISDRNSNTRRTKS